MKYILREFFRYSRTEQRGILFLVFVILSIQTARFVYPRLLDKEYPMSEEEARNFAAWVLKKEQLEEYVDLQEAGGASLAGNVRFEPFRFNPNTITHDDWLRLGFSEKQVVSIEKFIQKGGNFRYREDLKKLYAVTPERYALLEAWIDLPDKSGTAVSIKKQPFTFNDTTPLKRTGTRNPDPVELNSADTLRLRTIKGIGPYWARRIGKHRERMGGFYSIEQLKEMKGFPDSLFLKIAPLLYVDTGLIRKLSINTATEEELNKHPYCWYGVAKSIVNYRAKHGPFKHPDDIRNIYSIKPEACNKLIPYIHTE